jgi:DNA polymerase IV
MNACVESACPTPLLPEPVRAAERPPETTAEGRGQTRHWLSAALRRLVGGRAATSVPQIVHVDVDSFFVAVEQSLNPRLRGKAVLVVAGGVVASASHEAKSRGAIRGMKCPEALKLCPSAFVTPAQYKRYVDFADRVARILERYAPAVEMVALGSFYLDFSGTAISLVEYAALLRCMQADVLGRTGLSTSVGVATSRIVASAAARQHRPCGLRIVVLGQEAEFLIPFPVEALQGVGRTFTSALAQGGIATIGELQRIPKPVLAAAFGAAMGKHIWENARGRDASGFLTSPLTAEFCSSTVPA